jgi:hypothetical protein
MVIKTTLDLKAIGLRVMKLMIFCIIGIVLTSYAYGATTYTSVGNGDFDQAGTWSSSGSGSRLYYIILPGDTVTIDVDQQSFKTKRIDVGGIMIIDENLDIGKTAYVNIWAGGDLIRVSGRIKFKSYGNASEKISSSFSGGAAGGYWEASDVAWTTSGPLSVTLLNFSAEKLTTGVQLYWETASEIENSHFEVQRSDNGGEFLPIGRVEGNGTHTALLDYQFIDLNPVANGMYRLKILDYNDKYDYSLIIESPWVNSSRVFKNMFVVSSSNHAQTRHVIRLKNIPEAVTNIQLISSNGVRLLDQHYSYNHEFEKNTLTLSNPALKNEGIYYIIVSSQHAVTSLKFYVL